MCGIIGFLAKDDVHHASLGQYVVPMLVCMGDRGPDSAGLAVFSPPDHVDERRYSLFSAAEGNAWQQMSQTLAKLGPGRLESNGRHATLSTTCPPDAVRAWLAEHHGDVHLLSVGRALEVYKDTGHPREIAERYGFSKLTGTHCVGHTRMATESAVTPVHSHPFTAGEDFCLVHNGSLSNPSQLRRKLEREGVEFESDNDSEVICRQLYWRMSQGDSIEEALETSFAVLDGFYTLLIGTIDKLVLVRDAFACKPAVVAETDDYVAIGSEFRTLAHLPGIDDARLFEPRPEVIYSWSL